MLEWPISAREGRNLIPSEERKTCSEKNTGEVDRACSPGGPVEFKKAVDAPGD